MKKRKMLSWVISLALIFSITSAFVITSNANEGDPAEVGSNDYLSIDKNPQLDGAFDSKAVTVEVDNNVLKDGDYIYSDGTSKAGNTKTQPAGSGYLWYHKGRLLLNGYTLNSTDNSGTILITLKDNTSVTLYVDIIGNNSITTSSIAFRCDRYGYPNSSVKLVFSEKETGASLSITNNYKLACMSVNDIVFNSGKYILQSNQKEQRYSIDADDFIINGGEISIMDSDWGIGSDCFTMNGGTIKITGTNRGIYSNQVNINNGIVDISASYYAIHTDSKTIKIKNSKVTAQSTNAKAFYPSVKLSGNPTVYAGSSSNDKKLLESGGNNIEQYQYVEINDDGKTSIFDNIISSLSKIFTSIFKTDLGSLLSRLWIVKLLDKIF